jgi:hypothetical protein
MQMRSSCILSLCFFVFFSEGRSPASCKRAAAASFHADAQQLHPVFMFFCFFFEGRSPVSCRCEAAASVDVF